MMYLARIWVLKIHTNRVVYRISRNPGHDRFSASCMARTVKKYSNPTKHLLGLNTKTLPTGA